MSAYELPSLPQGWDWSQEPEKAVLSAEYLLELPEVHPRAESPVEVVAHRDGNDDILVRHCNHEDRVSVVHLTWRQAKELPNHPTVEFTGPHTEFLAWELRRYGVSPKP